MKTILTCLTTILIAVSVQSQVILDDCFSSVEPSPSFVGSDDITNFDADLLEWDGSQWIGQWPNAQVDVAPFTETMGCRAMWIGNATSWTTGGEGFGLKLEQSLVAGQQYAFNFLYVSDGNGGDGAFAPTVMSNDIQALIGANTIGSLPAAGYDWMTNTFEFTATADQDGDIWLIVTTAPDASSGLIASWCENCGNDQGSCEFELGDDLSICEGDSVLIGASVPGVSYLWQDGSTDNELYASEPGTYWLQTSSNKCSFTDSLDVMFLESSITAGPDFAICPNDTTTLEADGGLSYEWSNGLGSDAIVQIHPEETTTYVLTGLDNNGCVAVDSITVIVHPEIPVSISGLEQGTYCLEDIEISLTGDPVGGFFQGPGMVDGSFNPDEAGIGIHTITYTFEDQFGCKHESAEQVVVELCDQISVREIGISVFPNPTANQLNIRWDAPQAQLQSIQLFDIRGRKMKVSTERSNNLVIVDLQHLAQGNYQLFISTNLGLFLERIMIAK